MLLLLLACRPAAVAPVAPPAAQAATETTIWPGEGAAPVRLAEGCAAARARLGEPSETVAFEEGVSYDKWLSRGLCVLCRGDAMEAIFAYSGRKGGYDDDPWAPYPARLDNGITFDTSYDEVIAAMGEPQGSG